MTPTSTAPISVEPGSPGETDSAAFAALETAFGDTLKDLLADYVAMSDEACEALQIAAGCAHWQEAARLALKIGAAAGDMGFRPITIAARNFADATYQNTSAHGMRNGAQMVVFEYERLRLALQSRFPDFVAAGAYSVD
jgi:hypothetical protein